MFLLNICTDYIVGCIFTNDLLIVDCAGILFAVCNYIEDELVGAMNDFLEFDAVDDEETEIAELEVDFIQRLANAYCDAIFAGMLSDGSSPAIFVVVGVTDGIVALCIDLVSDLLRTIDCIQICVGGNELMELMLIAFEIISYLLRAVSIAIRIFANMTSGALLSALMAPEFVAQFVFDAGISVSVSQIFAIIFTLVQAVAMSVIECGVGCIQAYVYLYLARTYCNVLR